MEVPSTVTSGFFRDELERALAENGFALMAWEVLGSDDAGKGQQAHAEAKVELLPEKEQQGDKGAIVEVQLTLVGYQLQQGHDDRRYHETLDDLLSAVSPAYVRRRQKLLFAKLEEVAKSRSWNDEQDEQEEQEQAR
ncbi:hypothetical protein P389DRAFT_196858 [Cystobasidium minutum MCA 4210]|uniref:uncharacterized protein n=1 Tax=Cystobasidium minutum MCA 4210 TaxID=1397322 RepID=UPI0034CE2FCD|eukprot:jgi/Rhomi1/196858/gm1.5072_g